MQDWIKSFETKNVLFQMILSNRVLSFGLPIFHDYLLNFAVFKTICNVALAEYSRIEFYGVISI